MNNIEEKQKNHAGGTKGLKYYNECNYNWTHGNTELMEIMHMIKIMKTILRRLLNEKIKPMKEKIIIRMQSIHEQFWMFVNKRLLKIII